MKHSIKRQMTAVFMGLMLCFLIALLVLNARYLEPYYISNKETSFIHMYNVLKDAVENDRVEETEVSNELQHLAEKGNLSFLVIEEENERVVTNVRNMDILKNQLLGYLLNQAQKNGRILESTDDYQLMQSKDAWNETEYIEMWGTFEDGSRFLIRSPLESIKESAEISNRFFIYIGCAMVVISMILVWYFSKRLTDPIHELAVLSDKMANLDFEAKYTSGGDNEIGELGANFNRMSEKLESAISELKSANNSLQKDIERKEKMEEMRNEFLGNVSHELKTPIALIQGYAEGLKEGVNDDPESREFYCDVIMDEATKMNQMVKNLLTLNQLEFGDEEIAFERFNLTELIQGILQSMEIMAQQKEAKVIFRQTEPVYVWADEYKVEQVIRNYVSNAFHHVDGEKVIEVKIQTADGKAKTSVFNTGTPIPEKDIPHIWDKFYKVDKAHTREYGGNGIGLSIVKAIMESFHQKYGVNNYDNGVEFWFQLDIL
ncbi:HAMP domain-containing protein [Faecalicatena contorta]|uniref:sensor histidine kinase n=1 Tax=Faecalicatena contorta TaxID=39482 RepID=UPI001F42334C|nr:HAMP domain-containing sensor histidine kinase [Faecalicatena contorta]MCF2681014.1 HAMP domain-containing protein [Faecalicatena contorta]